MNRVESRSIIAVRVWRQLINSLQFHVFPRLSVSRVVIQSNFLVWFLQIELPVIH